MGTDDVMQELGMAYLTAVLEYARASHAAWATLWARPHPPPRPAPNYPQGVDIEVPLGNR